MLKISKKTKFAAVVLCLTIITAMAACGKSSDGGNQASADGKEKRVVQYAHPDAISPTSPYEVFGKYFKQYLGELSGGQWDTDIVGGAQLGNESELAVSVSSGLIDMTMSSNIVIANTSMDSAALLLPFMFQNHDEVNYVVEDEQVLEMINASLLKDANVIGLDYTSNGLRKLFMRESYGDSPVLGNLKNKKIRVPETPLPVDTFKALNMTPTTISGSEVITAMQQGTVDGCDYPILPAMASGFGELAKTMINTNHYYVGCSIIFSANFWNSLTDEEKGWFKEASQKAAHQQRMDLGRMEKELTEKMITQGCIPVETDIQPYIDATKPIYEKYAAKINPKLIERVEFLLEEYRASHK